jgi:hypothetical protein
MNQDVLKHIDEIRTHRNKYLNGQYGEITLNEFKTKMEGLYNSFCEKCPVIFERAAEGFFDRPEEMNRLRMAMGLIEKTKSGEITKEDGEKNFGQHLVDTFVKPHVPESARNIPK